MEGKPQLYPKGDVAASAETTEGASYSAAIARISRVIYEAVRAHGFGGGFRAISDYDSAPNTVRDYLRQLCTYVVNNPFIGPETLYEHVLTTYGELKEYPIANDPLLFGLEESLLTNRTWLDLTENDRRRFVLVKACVMGMWTPTVPGEEAGDLDGI